MILHRNKDGIYFPVPTITLPFADAPFVTTMTVHASVLTVISKISATPAIILLIKQSPPANNSFIIYYNKTTAEKSTAVKILLLTLF
jgi:hypothetical protein